MAEDHSLLTILFVGEFTFGCGDGDGAYRIGKNIHARAAHVEDAVRQPDHPDRFDRQPDGGKNDGDGYQTGGGDARDADAGGEGEHDDEQLLGDIQCHLTGRRVELRDKEYDHALVQSRAIHVDGRA